MGNVFRCISSRLRERVRAPRAVHTAVALMASTTLLVTATALSAATDADVRARDLHIIGDPCADARVDEGGVLVAMWSTTVATDENALILGPHAASGTAVAASGGSTHVARVPELVPGATIHFRAVSRRSATEETVQSGDCAIAVPGADRRAPFLSALEVSGRTSTTARIHVLTDEPTRAMITVLAAGAPAGDLEVVAPSDFRVRHDIALARLAPGTAYIIRLDLLDPAGNATVPPLVTFTTDEEE